MVNRIEIGFRNNIRDALGEKLKRRIVENLRIDVEEVSTIDVFTIEGNLTKAELREAATGPLSDPVIQKHAVNSALAEGFDWLIEVGFLPGVTDNVGKTATEAIELLVEIPGVAQCEILRDLLFQVGPAGLQAGEQIRGHGGRPG